MAVLVDHSFTLWSLAWDARNRAVEFALKQPRDFASDATVAIILAAASTEAFINELADAIRVERDRPQLFSFLPQLIAFLDAYEQLENSTDGVDPHPLVGSRRWYSDLVRVVLSRLCPRRKGPRRGSTQEKYLIVSEKLSGAPFDKGAKPYQPFSTLMRLRDLHMHLRCWDRDGPVGDSLTITPPEGRIGFVKSLMQMGLTWECHEDREIGTSWLHLLQTARMADWACRAALNIICAVLDMIPDRPGDTTALLFKKDFGRRTDDWIEESPALP